MKKSNNIDVVARTVRQSVNATRITCNNGLTRVVNVMVVLSDARIEVAKALRSDMEAPKALSRVLKTHFGILFGHRTLLVDIQMRFLAFFKL